MESNFFLEILLNLMWLEPLVHERNVPCMVTATAPNVVGLL
jgi:hypothetical protein